VPVNLVMSLSQRRIRAMLMVSVLFAALVVAQVATAPPASATEHGVRTKLISRFNNGDVAYVKVAVERKVDGIDVLARAHVKVWCQNSNGQTVVCEEVEIGVIGGNPESLSLETWTSSGWSSVDGRFVGSFAEVYPALDQYTGWICTGSLSDDWRTVAYNVRVTARSGQPGSFHDVPSNTAYNMGFGCPV
jgi:hypothetical protein